MFESAIVLDEAGFIGNYLKKEGLSASENFIRKYMAKSLNTKF